MLLALSAVNAPVPAPVAPIEGKSAAPVPRRSDWLPCPVEISSPVQDIKSDSSINCASADYIDHFAPILRESGVVRQCENTRSCCRRRGRRKRRHPRNGTGAAHTEVIVVGQVRTVIGQLRITLRRSSRPQRDRSCRSGSRNAAATCQHHMVRSIEREIICWRARRETGERHMAAGDERIDRGIAVAIDRGKHRTVLIGPLLQRGCLSAASAHNAKLGTSMPDVPMMFTSGSLAEPVA